MWSARSLALHVLSWRTMVRGWSGMPLDVQTVHFVTSFSLGKIIEPWADWASWAESAELCKSPPLFSGPCGPHGTKPVPVFF